jgi:DeoR/GlpR family transcriptional regulator of sugar metabolism
MAEHYAPKFRRAAIIQLLMERGAMTCAEIVRATGWSRATLVHHLDILQERGKIYRYPKPVQVYSITPPPPLRTLAEIYDSLASY